MTTEYLVIHYCSNWQAVETVCKGFPNLDIVPPLT